MYFNKDELKEKLTLEQAYEIIELLGGDPKYTNFGFTANTICHNHIGEGSRKLYYYDNTKLFHCYTECGSMDLFDTICHIKNLQDTEDWNLYDAMVFVVNTFGLQNENIAYNQKDNNIKLDLQILNNYSIISKSKEKIKLEYNLYDDKILKNLSFVVPKNWVQEGISIETMKKYNIRYYGTDHKIVIPHYNLNNELIGIRGRALVSSDAELYGKYMPIKINNILYSHPLSYNLYGLNFNLKNIQKSKKIIIFEGEKSVLLYDSFFGEENNISVATCGSSISLIQQDLIKGICDVDEVIFAYDKQFQSIGDAEFNKDIKLLKSLGDKFKNYCNVSVLFDKYDKLNYKDAPIDKGKENFEFLFQNRILL